MTARKLLPIKNDVVFHLYFGDEENKDDLKSFLKSVLELPEEEYDVLYISDPFLRGEYPKEKIGIVDLKIKTKSGKTIHIEVQLLVLPDLRKRIFFYDAKLIAEQIGSGGKYSTINDVVTILITDEILIQESPRYHHRFTFFDKDACVELTDLLRIHTLELPKLPPVPDGTELHDWASFIAAETEEELNMVSERNEQIGHAADKLRILSNDERARELYELRLKEWRDIESFKDDAYEKGEKSGYGKGEKSGYEKGEKSGYEKGEKSGYEKGEKSGYEKGAQITASDIALKLLKLGRPVDEISAVTELSIKEIEQLSLAR